MSKLILTALALTAVRVVFAGAPESDPGVRILELPCLIYQDKLTIYLPRGLDLAPAFALLRRNIQQELVVTEIALALPKLTLSDRHDFIPVFKEMGVRQVFTEEADLSNIFERNSLPIRVTDVLQGTTLSFDEEGIRATAASIACGGFGGGPPPPKEAPPAPIPFKVDHPFLFTLSTADGICLFMGAAREP